MIFTAGADGEIKVWEIPQRFKPENNLTTSDYNNLFLTARW